MLNSKCDNYKMEYNTDLHKYFFYTKKHDAFSNEYWTRLGTNDANYFEAIGSIIETLVDAANIDPATLTREFT